MEDIFVPKSKLSDAKVGPLHTVTIITSEKDRMQKIFEDGYGLTGSEWHRPPSEARASLSRYFDIDQEHDWQVARFRRSGSGQNVQVRLIQIDAETPPVRPSHEGLYQGGATLSFPIDDLYAHENRMASIGVDSTIGVKEMEFTSPTGETYVSAEIVYKAPDGVFVMGVKRPDIFVPVGPINPDAGMGAPAYSARCILETEETLGFFENVLGYEIRRDVEFTVGEKSAINMPEGTNERFIQGFAPGSASGYVVLMDHGSDTKRGPSKGFGPPNRGIVMWTMPSRDLDTLSERTLASGAKILQPPSDVSSPFLPGARTMIIEDPDGFPMEFFEHDF